MHNHRLINGHFRCGEWMLISPPTSRGYRFILAMTDYFSKWAEAIPLKEVKASNTIKFIKHHVLYRFGVL